MTRHQPDQQESMMPEKHPPPPSIPPSPGDVSLAVKDVVRGGRFNLRRSAENLAKRWEGGKAARGGRGRRGPFVLSCRADRQGSERHDTHVADGGPRGRSSSRARQVVSGYVGAAVLVCCLFQRGIDAR